MPAANALAQLGLTEGLGAVAEAIVEIDPDETSELVEWASALLDLGGTLPDPVRTALQRKQSHAGARAVLALADRS